MGESLNEPRCCDEVCLNPNHSILTLTGWFTVTKLYQHVDKKRKKIQRDTNQSVVPNKPTVCQAIPPVCADTGAVDAVLQQSGPQHANRT